MTDTDRSIQSDSDSGDRSPETDPHRESPERHGSRWDRFDPRRVLRSLRGGRKRAPSSRGDRESGAPARVDQGRSRSDTDPITRRINTVVTNRPWTVVVVFVLLTGVFLGGALVGGGDQEAGTDQFTEDSEAQQAFDDMQENFGDNSRDTGGDSAQLFVEDDRNVLSKPSLLRMLEFQDRVENEDGLRVESTTSPASLTAQQIDPTAETPEEQYRVIDRASQREIDAAIAAADEQAGLPVSTDFTRKSASASVAQIAVTYDTAPMADTSDNAHLQFQTQEIANDIDGFDTDENVVIFADAIFDEEILQLLGDTAIVVFPAAIILIMFFLIVAYRDPIDLGLGVAALVMTLIWTFGFMGFARIPFSDSLITVFPLLLAVGIDFGIHIINRYREERATGASIEESMGITTNQLTAALLIVTITTVFSFAANMVSEMNREFGLVAAAGIVFTFLLFGVFLPAGKVGCDRLREGTRFPEFGTSPLGKEDSFLGDVLPIGVKIARVAPAVFLVAMLVVGGSAAVYGTGVDTEFDQEAFFPDEDRIEQYKSLPGPLAPGEYTFMQVLEHMEEDFEISLDGTVTIYVEDNDLRSDGALRELDRSLQDPPDAFQTDGRQADADSILSVIDSQRAADPEFARTVERYDSSGDGIPDRDVDVVYDDLFATDAGAESRLTTDRGATRIDIPIDVDAEQDEAVADGRQIASEMRMDATATGQLVIFEAVIDEMTDAAVQSLFAAFLLTTVFLIVSYWWLEGRAIYGVLNLVPVLLSVALLAGSMRFFDIPLTPINAPILSVSIGLGVDYTVHFMHRFVDEYEEGNDAHDALLVTVRGTGGALTGSMLTTVCGLGVLYFALIPLIMEFGMLLALGVFYAWLCSILVLPSTVVVWDRLENEHATTDHLPWA
ncbi:MMPL family transporter [Natrialba sp. INN-245]|uniref:efflux RND transporter permease subunit n=1 Tax=Natrialba sp. INN-245 TaxID=2690967 RepID=UPI001313185A|nr:MMPL family transporter [Natrialba sp. INN-245]MWV40101.1 MMPL family transporter [Natrialba sp. INN-245]